MSRSIWREGIASYKALASADAMTVAPQQDCFRRQTNSAAVGTAGVMIVAKPIRLYTATFENASTTNAYYIQLFDGVTDPTSGAVPIWQKRLVPRSQESSCAEFSFAQINGLVFSKGDGFAISTTPELLTLATQNDVALRSVVYTAGR